MAGINTLQEVYAKRGEDWTREFLSSELSITEKTDAYRFSFEISRNGKLRFYGKNAEAPLNRIDRTVSDLYESAIAKIEKLPDAILVNLPKSHRFGFGWSPESGLTLTDITIRQHGKVTKQIQEQALLEKWASLLHVKSGEVLQGSLDQSFVEQIMESLRSGDQRLTEAWDPQKTYILKNTEGIVKVSPPEHKQVREQKSHAFDLLLFQIYEHVTRVQFDRFQFRSERPDERYLEIVSEAFNGFVKEKGQEFLEMGIQKPRFLERSGKFNPRWIRNQKTLSILSENRNYEYLLSIFITNLRKPKRAVGLLTEAFTKSYNQKINELEEAVRTADSYEFPEFNTILEKEEKDVKEDTGFSDEESMRAIGMMQSYFAVPFQNTNEEKEAPIHECNLLLMNAGEITHSVLNECERLLKLTGKSFVLAHDESAGSSCKWGLSKEAGAAAAQQLVKEYPHIFECTESMHHPSLERALAAGGQREIKRIYTGRSCNGLLRECETYVMLSGKPIDLEISQVRGKTPTKEIEECMEKEDFKRFKELFPEPLQKFWNNMQSEWLAKAYL